MMNIAKQLQMTNDDLLKFTEPKAIYPHYQRRLVYDLNKNQIDLFDNLLIFPSSHSRTVKEKKEVMIMFLEQNPKFQDISYIHIWFRIAEDYLNTKCRIKVPYIPFVAATRGRTPVNTQMSFFNSNRSNLTQNYNRNEVCDDYDNNDEDEEINELSFLMTKLSIM